MINLENVTLVSIDSAKDYNSKSNIRLAAISRLIPEICKHINFGDTLIINPFNKNNHLISERFETLWEFNWEHSGGIAWYNNFLIKKLPHLIKTDWYLIVQWDGFPRWNSYYWDKEFFNYPYLGGGHSLLNGGFSLRNTNVMREISKSTDTFDTGAEDGFYSRFFDNEFSKDYQTSIKIPWPPESVINKFCFFEDSKYEQNTFGWHRGYAMSKQAIKNIFNQTNIFSESETNKLVDYCLAKELNNDYFDVNQMHEIINLEYNQSFFDNY